MSQSSGYMGSKGISSDDEPPEITRLKEVYKRIFAKDRCAHCGIKVKDNTVWCFTCQERITRMVRRG